MTAFLPICAGLASLTPISVQATSLPEYALQKVLGDASPIFGNYVKETNANTEWMKRYPDDTSIVHMNIPGTHDSATWNYSQVTQDALSSIADLNQVTVPPPETFRCQERSLISMLNSGIRAMDLRYAFDPTNTSLIFYHSQALLSEMANLQNVLFGFYQWLDDHPSETIILSLQYEGSTAKYYANDAKVQLALFDALTSTAARNYFLQTKD